MFRPIKSTRLTTNLNIVQKNQVRQLRVRPVLPVVQKSKNVPPTEQPLNDANLSFNEAEILQKPVRQITRSRFGKVTNTGQGDDAEWKQLIKTLYNKPPAQIERELKQKFEQDGIEYDPLFVQRLIEESRHEEGVLEGMMEDEETAERINQDELVSFMDWMIEDALEQIDKQKDLAQDGHEMVDDFDRIMSEKPSEKTFIDAFVKVEDMADELRTTGLQKLPQFLELMNQTQNFEVRRHLPLDRLASLFAISTQITNETLRDECIFLAGNLIYSASEKRADPVNESFYIESLLNHGRIERAIELFETRRTKPDVQGQRFWLDTGATVYLKAEQFAKAEEVAQEIRSTYGYLNPVLVTTFVSSYLNVGRSEEAFKWWEQMKQVMDSHGLTETMEVVEPQLVDDENYVYDYHNREEPVSFNHVTDVVMDFLKHKKFDEAMEVILVATRRDKTFLLYFVDKFVGAVPYPGREALYQVLKSAEEENRFHPSVSHYIMRELELFHPVRAISFDEVAVLDECTGALKQLTIQPDAQVPNWVKVGSNSLISSISLGARLTTYECRDLFKILLFTKSRKNYMLVYKLLDAMNKSAQWVREGGEYGVIPPANAHIYLVLIQLLGRRRKPDLKKIEDLLDLMRDNGIPVYTVLANQVILTYKKSKRYDDAAKFIDRYLEENALQPTTELFINILRVYRDSASASSGHDTKYRARFDNLRKLFKGMIETPGWKFSEDFLHETILTFLKYSDEPSAICALIYYGMILQQELSPRLLLAIKLKFESSILKMQSRLSAEEQERMRGTIQLYHEECGLRSVTTMLRSNVPLNWRDGAALVVRYLAVFNYRPNPYFLKDPFWASISLEQVGENKREFEESLEKAEEYYGLPAVGLSEII